MPNLKKISRKTIVLIATAVMSSGVTYFFCNSQYSKEIETLNNEIQDLKESENKAKVIQRISEQMEDIAYQSKSIADSNLQRANFEREKAEEQTHRAEQERHNALIAKAQADMAEQQARIQAQKAENERIIAEQSRLTAEIERAKADTLRYISLGRSLAQTSITQFNTEEYDLARRLAYASFYFTTQYGGSAYQQDVFTSLLYSAHAAHNRIATLTGNVQVLKCIPHSGHFDDEDILVASDYGEIDLLCPNNTPGSHGFSEFTKTQLFSNNLYLFRDMCIIDSMAYILDVDGIITTVNISQSQRMLHAKNAKQSNNLVHFRIAGSTHPAERWSRLLKKKNGQLIAVGEHQLVWFDPKTHVIIREKYVDDNITEAGIGDGKLLIFTNKEKYYIFKEGIPAEWPFELAKHCTITAYYYLKSKHLHVVGTNIGVIYLYDNNGHLKYTFTGHTGPVTHIESSDWCLVSSSYDKTVRIWDLDELGGFIVPLEIKSSAWPLVFSIDKQSTTIRIGLSNGGVETVRYSAEENAASVKRHIERDFTIPEWQYYIGKDEPYKTFK